MIECLETKNVAGPCSACGAYQAEGVHIVRDALYCEACCPLCSPQASLEWETEPETIAGTQKGLF